jgi:hypothetical protein
VPGLPGGRSLFLLRQEKLTKRRRPHRTGPSGFPRFSEKIGRLPHKGTPTFYPLKRMKDRMHNSRFALRQSSPTAPGLPVLLGGGPRGISIKPIPTLAPSLKGRVRPCHTHRAEDFSGCPTWSCHPLPLCAASGWQANWGVSAAPCSSSATGHVLCALLGRVAQTPNLTDKPKVPVGRCGGGPFCLGTLFWASKIKYPAAGLPPAINQHAQSAFQPSNYMGNSLHRIPIGWCAACCD